MVWNHNTIITTSLYIGTFYWNGICCVRVIMCYHVIPCQRQIHQKYLAKNQYIVICHLLAFMKYACGCGTDMERFKLKDNQIFSAMFWMLILSEFQFCSCFPYCLARLYHFITICRSDAYLNIGFISFISFFFRYYLLNRYYLSVAQ